MTIEEITPFVNLTDLPEFAESIEAIKIGNMIHPASIFSPLAKEETNFPNKIMRELIEENTLTKAGFIPITEQGKKVFAAYSYIIGSVKTTRASLVLYPYSFTYKPAKSEETDPEPTSTTYAQGGIFELSPDKLPASGSSKFFNYIKTNTDVKIGKAKALYDINVAILRIESIVGKETVNLFYESEYCSSYFTSYFGKASTVEIGKEAFIEFRKNNPTSTTVVYYSHKDILNDGLFASDGSNNFGMLIIPDNVLGSEDAIKKLLTDKGIQKIKKFIENGGTVVTSGKSGYLLEQWGIISKGTYATDKLLTVATEDSSIVVETATSQSDSFEKKTLQMGQSKLSYQLGSYPIKETAKSSFEIIASFSASQTLRYKNVKTGIDTDLTDKEKEFLPFILYKASGKGRIILFNGNPLFKTAEHYYFSNALFLSMSKNAVFNGYVNFGDDNGLPIPGGEAGIQLSAKVEFLNLFDEAVTNYELHLYVPLKVDVIKATSQCTLVSTSQDYVEIDEKAFNTTSHYKCLKQTVKAFEQAIFEFKLEILDSSVTKKGTDIVIFYPIAVYEDAGVKTILDSTGIKVQASLGAILRGTLNPNPSSFYPYKGEGFTINTELSVENKENTLAKDSVFYSVIPLVSPLSDGGNLGKPTYYLEFYNKYYTDHRAKLTEEEISKGMFEVPMTTFGTIDYIYYDEINNHGVTLVADWDQPVKYLKEVNVDSTADGDEEVKVENSGQTTTIENTKIKLQQIYFNEADKFFELVSQRLMPFVDVTTAEGFEFYYKGSKVPSGIENTNKKGTSKYPLIFSRNDIYFYNSGDQYQVPEGLNHTHVISIDKYKNPTCNDKKKDVVVEGKFNHDDGLVPTEWANSLLLSCNRKQYDPTKEADLKALGPDVQLTHYLLQKTDEKITRAGDILGFKENSGDCTGYLEEYPSVKLTRAHSATIVVPGELSRQGGKLVMTLGGGFSFDVSDPVSAGYITYSANQVAFYKTTVENGKYVGYFKRGLMPNEANDKNTKLAIYFEHLTSSKKTTQGACVIQQSAPITIELYEVKYDISAKETEFETYVFRKKYTQDMPFNFFYSYPAVELAVRVKRKQSTTIKEYELMNPFTKIGVYMQELRKHRGIYTYTQATNVQAPSLVAPTGGFATVSNIGISNVPFAELLSHNTLSAIPGAPTTSRLEWVDIWGRKWAQPLRSLLPDVPPGTPPHRSFTMQTTYELLDRSGKNRILDWSSDEEAYVRVQMKFLNIYPKYFLSITCPENSVIYEKEKVQTYRQDRYYSEEPTYKIISNDTAQAKVSNKYLQFGSSSIYGKCFTQAGSCLSGKKLTEEDFEQMKYAMTCSQSLNSEKLKECAKKLENIKTLRKKKSGDKDECDNKFNYSPTVESFYPSGYITNEMWDLTHHTYDDNAYNKAYRYHSDNCVPSLDASPNGNPSLYKPQNVIAFPLFKGLGYSMTYSSNLSVSKYSAYKGWWTDNLQNKDDTLLAGQIQSNSISVGAKDLLNDKMWVNWKKMDDPHGIIKERVKNIYACLFNQNRIKMTPGQKVFAYPNNIFQNNVIPIFSDIEEKDKRLTEYDCTDKYQYTPRNISKVDNVLKTSTDRDWLYFGTSLRGGAKENLNILVKLSPFSTHKQEGVTKVQDGGRFVYWNPVGPANMFLVVDSPVNTVEAIRVDYSMTSTLLPSTTTTFNGVMYQIITVKDDSEENREYKMSTYMNSYGFGDSTVSVYVGGINDSSCKVEPGGTTYIKISFYNNCGFAWNMLGGAMDFSKKKQLKVNDKELLSKYVDNVKQPTKYNFMTLSIPKEIEKYIKIVPSDHASKTSSSIINRVSIGDTLEGDYFYKLTVSKDFPSELRGRLHTINVTLNEEYFEKLPGKDDPTGVHDYNLAIPSIKFGVPYPSSSPYAGKIFHTFGRGSQLLVKARYHEDVLVENVKFISDEKILAFREATSDSEKARELMKNLFQELEVDSSLTYEFEAPTIKIDLSKTKYSVFPKENLGNLDTTSFNLIVKLNIPQTSYSNKKVISATSMEYKNHKGVAKTSAVPYPAYRWAIARGAWLRPSYSYQVVEEQDDGTFKKSPVQGITETDEGIIQLSITATNVGTDISYKLRFTVETENKVEFLEDKMTTKYPCTVDGNVIEVRPGGNLSPGSKSTIILYFKYSPEEKTLRNLGESGRTRQILKRVEAGMDLTSTSGEVPVVQKLSSFSISLVKKQIEATLKAIEIEPNPSFAIEVSKDESLKGDFVYQYERKTIMNETESKYTVIKDKISENSIVDEPFTDELANYTYYTVWYRISIFNKDGKDEISHTNVFYSFTTAGGKEEEEEKKEEKKGFPLWGIILIVIGALALLGIGGFLMYKKLSKKEDVETRPLVQELGTIQQSNEHEGNIKTVTKTEETFVSRMTEEN